jgi:hypothetical protein
MFRIKKFFHGIFEFFTHVIIRKKLLQIKFSWVAKKHFVRYTSRYYCLAEKNDGKSFEFNNPKESIFERNNLPFAFVLIIWYHKDAEFTYAREKITALC